MLPSSLQHKEKSTQKTRRDYKGCSRGYPPLHRANKWESHVWPLWTVGKITASKTCFSAAVDLIIVSGLIVHCKTVRFKDLSENENDLMPCTPRWGPLGSPWQRNLCRNRLQRLGHIRYTVATWECCVNGFGLMNQPSAYYFVKKLHLYKSRASYFFTHSKLISSIWIRLLASRNHDAMSRSFMQPQQLAACRVLNNLTWAVGSRITLYRHVFFLSLWCSLEIRSDHPCWHCVLTLHEMHTIMQMLWKVIKPHSSLRILPHLSCSPLSRLRRKPTVLDGSEDSACAAGVHL